MLLGGSEFAILGFHRTMPGKLVEWPNWPEFSLKTGEHGDDLIGYKKAIVDEFGEEALTQAWLKTCKALKSVTEEIAQAGTAYIPEVKFDELFDLPAERRQQLKDIGCFKVKGVFDRKQADQWFHELKAYVANNKDSISGRQAPGAETAMR